MSISKNPFSKKEVVNTESKEVKLKTKKEVVSVESKKGKRVVKVHKGVFEERNL